MDSELLLPVLVVAGAYLVGSIPFSWLVARLVKRVDIRAVGSGNVGATNVLRNAGKRAAILALLLDGVKGWAVVYVTALLTETSHWQLGSGGRTVIDSPSFWIGLSALVAIIGHMFPVWLRFRGGKGVATGAGAYLAIDPSALLFAFVTFLAVVAVTRYVSVGSMAAAAVFPMWIRFLTGGTTWEIVFSVLIGLLVIIKHHPNIARILAGEERKFPR
ncbi:MAG: glycerol-3-phosphate 1-O-acyltransferase PlsY [Thermoanaerobaculia bacterium]|nr:glycerol-3-phosphate 1-O-acyltransferase PlsY [Thermoanaerobaculia bacterium]